MLKKLTEKLQLAERRYEELNRLMADPEVATDPKRMAEYAREQAELEELVQTYRKYRELERQLAEAKELLEESDDEEMRELAKSEIDRLEGELERLETQVKKLLLPKDPRDERDVIMEIRAGAGGEEAALFAADLYRMYTRYAEKKGWRTELLSANETGLGGFKEVIFQVKGRGAYSHLKYESGVHRVQRVPITESSGRIHTSTATVAVLPQVDEVEVHIDPKDLRIDVYRSSGPGGQHMQKNATAVRITHIPTGITVACESERSQVQNRQRAMAILRARLYDLEQRKVREQVDRERRAQVGTGERSEKIRTYNFPQNRVTDHRIGLTSYRLEEILDGELDEFIEALAAEEQAKK
ncbi:MAG TPA: peptide chain release factor 1, partial [Chloroflexi bacterium]|nr:peptide chain release factor 1 [Chloroflexota bacterium]